MKKRITIALGVLVACVPLFAQPYELRLRTTLALESAWVALGGATTITGDSTSELNLRLVQAAEGIATLLDGGVVGASGITNLTDVALGTLTDGEVLVWDDSEGVWTNTTVAGVGDMTKAVYDDNDDGVIDTDALPAFQLEDAALTALIADPAMYQATNANLTAWAALETSAKQDADAALDALVANPNLYQATNSALTALATNPNLYQSTNAVLTRLASIGAGTAGDVIYRDATGWTNLAKGDDGQVLKLVSGLPSWAADNEGEEGGGLTEGEASLLYQATNSALTALASNPAMYQATNDNLTALAGSTPTASKVWKTDGEGVADWRDDATAEGGDGAPEGTVVNTGTPEQYELPMYSDTTGTNQAPSGITTDGAGGMTTTDFTTGTLTVTSAIEAPVLTFGSGTATNNIGAHMMAPVATNVVDMTFASRFVTLDGALTMVHVTNAVASTELTHVLYLRAGGEDRAFAIPATWQTNTFSPVPASITNGYLTKMFVTTIDATTDAASQTNAMVSFEYYKVP